MKVYDVRNFNAATDGVILIGGFVGELLLSLTCILDYILASPANQNFVFTEDLVHQFLVDLLGQEESPYPDEICKLTLDVPLTEYNNGEEPSIDQASYIIQDSTNIADQGLRLMLALQRDLVLNNDLINCFFKAISKISLSKPLEHIAEPEPLDAEATPEQKEAFDQLTSETAAKNAEIDTENKKLEVL